MARGDAHRFDHVVGDIGVAAAGDLKCQVEMKIVSVITDPVVVDTILRHVDEGGGHDPHDACAPPAA